MPNLPSYNVICKYCCDGTQERQAEIVCLVGHSVQKLGTLESACLDSDFWVTSDYLCDLSQITLHSTYLIFLMCARIGMMEISSKVVFTS